MMAGAIRPGSKSSLIVSILLLSSSFAFSQRGGERVFEFVQLPTSARSTALGASQISAITNDYGLVGGNPAMLNASMDKTFIFQHNFYFDGIDNGYAGYAKFFPKIDATLHAGVQYVSYGKFTAADDMGNVTGEFKASDLSLQVGIAKQLNERMSGGLRLQYIQSSYEAYMSNGILLDAGITYASEDGLNHYALVFRSLGFQFSTYYEGDEPGHAPTDLQFGFSKRLAHTPFRLSILMHDINRWDLHYDSPLEEDTSLGFGEDEPKKQSSFSKGVDNFFRHLTFGGEIIIGKNENVMLRFAYNHQMAQELQVVNLRSLAGFSGGVGVNFKAFILDYGFAIYHQAGASKHLGIRVPLSSMKEKSIIE